MRKLITILMLVCVMGLSACGGNVKMEKYMKVMDIHILKY